MLSLEGKIRGQIELICDVSGELYIQELDYPLALYIADGIWNIQSQSKRLDSFEVIEFFDGFVDLTYILASEIESIRSETKMVAGKCPIILANLQAITNNPIA